MKMNIRSCLLLLLGLLIIHSEALGSQITDLIKGGMSYPITRTILHLQPGITWETANEHAWNIYKQAERTGLDWKLLIAITYQESSFRTFKGDKTCGLTARGTPQCVYRAFGPMHVYYSYWETQLKLDPIRLIYEIQYGYKVGTDILLLKRRYRNTDPYWFARYNSNTPKYKIRYAKRIMKHYNKIDKYILENLKRGPSNGGKY